MNKQEVYKELWALIRDWNEDACYRIENTWIAFANLNGDYELLLSAIKTMFLVMPRDIELEVNDE